MCGAGGAGAFRRVGLAAREGLMLQAGGQPVASLKDEELPTPLLLHLFICPFAPGQTLCWTQGHQGEADLALPKVP